MQPHQIEYWALQIVDRVQNNQAIEDFRVELKATWPAPEKAARRIAGHANAARGAPVLWLIGVDEKQRVVTGAQHKDLAGWFSQVQTQFDGLAPQLTDLNIPIDGQTIVVLFFETTRRPFVVKNPKYGQPEGGPVSLEVPWREGTHTRSARREELVRLLSPLQALPNFEVLEADLSCEETSSGDHIWMLSVALYIEIDSQQPIIIPFHRCSLSVTLLESNISVPFPSLRLAPPSTPFFPGTESKILSQTINVTEDEILVHGPGKMLLRADHRLSPMAVDPTHKVTVDVSVLPVHAEQGVPINITLFPKNKADRDKKYSWELQRDSGNPESE